MVDLSVHLSSPFYLTASQHPHCPSGPLCSLTSPASAESLRPQLQPDSAWPSSLRACHHPSSLDLPVSQLFTPSVGQCPPCSISSGHVGGQALLVGFGCKAMRGLSVPGSMSLSDGILFFRLIMSCAEDVSRTTERDKPSQIRK